MHCAHALDDVAEPRLPPPASMSAKGVGGGDSTGQQSPEERCRLGKRQRHVGGEPMECSYNRCVYTGLSIYTYIH